MPTGISALPNVQWPYLVILIRLALALVLGLLLGLERERRGKEAGLRTFGFIAMLGALGGSLGESFALLAFTMTGVIAVLLNIQTLRAGAGTELTTSAAMLVTSMAGILCGQGQTITPAAVMVTSTALLAWKERLAGFSMDLTEGELRSALLLAILAIVIYPALPSGAIGPWRIIDPRAAWITVILIASIGFVNYILWKLYGTRGTELSGFFGGLVNSNFTVIEMATRVRESQGRFAAPAYRGILIAIAAMVVRNATLLLILAPVALLDAAGAFVLMLAASAGLVLVSHLRASTEVTRETAEIKLTLPFSLTVALKYGALFLLLHMVGTLMQREYGEAGFYSVTLIGGLLSSASAVAAAASMASQGAISPVVAGNGAVLASLTSIAFSLSFVLRTRHRGLVRRLGFAMLCVAAAGALGLMLGSGLRDVLAPWITAVEVPH
ncbi:MAG: MgtC/SapB family protein [Gammaproteobacteria bacterium]|nr:MgtC/SapB family protein [Gammaproteobacteria bacterium]